LTPARPQFQDHARGTNRKEKNNASVDPRPYFLSIAKSAMQAPPEKLAYLAMLNPKRDGGPDAMGVVDVDPAHARETREPGEHARGGR
jgi:hypothetical protein